MWQLIFQPFRHLTYVTAHSPTFPSLNIRHSSFSNPSVALPTSQLILHPLVASPTSQLILQPLLRFSYDTTSSLKTPIEPLMKYMDEFIRKYTSILSYLKGARRFQLVAFCPIRHTSSSVRPAMLSSSLDITKGTIVAGTDGLLKYKLL